MFKKPLFWGFLFCIINENIIKIDVLIVSVIITLAPDD